MAIILNRSLSRSFAETCSAEFRESRELEELLAFGNPGISLSAFLHTPPPKLRNLDISSCSLEELDMGAGFSALAQSLDTLNLARNCITRLPECMAQLTALTSLNIGGNAWAAAEGNDGADRAVRTGGDVAVDFVCAHLTQLTILQIYKAELSQLPPALGRLSSLTELNLFGNSALGNPAAALICSTVSDTACETKRSRTSGRQSR